MQSLALIDFSQVMQLYCDIMYCTTNVAFYLFQMWPTYLSNLTKNCLQTTLRQLQNMKLKMFLLQQVSEYENRLVATTGWYLNKLTASAGWCLNMCTFFNLLDTSASCHQCMVTNVVKSFIDQELPFFTTTPHFKNFIGSKRDYCQFNHFQTLMSQLVSKLSCQVKLEQAPPKLLLSRQILLKLMRLRRRYYVVFVRSCYMTVSGRP